MFLDDPKYQTDSRFQDMSFDKMSKDIILYYIIIIQNRRWDRIGEEERKPNNKEIHDFFYLDYFQSVGEFLFQQKCKLSFK